MLFKSWASASYSNLGEAVYDINVHETFQAARC